MNTLFGHLLHIYSPDLPQRIIARIVCVTIANALCAVCGVVLVKKYFDVMNILS